MRKKIYIMFDKQQSVCRWNPLFPHFSLITFILFTENKQLLSLSNRFDAFITDFCLLLNTAAAIYSQCTDFHIRAYKYCWLTDLGSTLILYLSSIIILISVFYDSISGQLLVTMPTSGLQWQSSRTQSKLNTSFAHKKKTIFRNPHYTWTIHAL